MCVDRSMIEIKKKLTNNGNRNNDTVRNLYCKDKKHTFAPYDDKNQRVA